MRGLSQMNTLSRNTSIRKNHSCVPTAHKETQHRQGFVPDATSDSTRSPEVFAEKGEDHRDRLTMTTQTLPLLTTRIRQDDGDDESTLARQWRLLKLLTFTPKGFTLKELAAVAAVCEKTVSRDLALLRHVGFDVSETVEDFGRKLWRVRRLPESTRGRGSTREKYGVIHDTLGDLHDVALILGDSALAEALKRLQEWVGGKCHGRKPKPR